MVRHNLYWHVGEVSGPATILLDTGIQPLSIIKRALWVKNRRLCSTKRPQRMVSR